MIRRSERATLDAAEEATAWTTEFPSQPASPRTRAVPKVGRQGGLSAKRLQV
jgi:hypothetical protein